MAARRVLIIGAGGAGLAAAVEAAHAGAQVLVVDAAQQVGGATAMSAGVLNVADTHVQKEAGLQDSLDEYYSYYMTVTNHELEPRLVRTACEGASEAMAWLEGMGLRFPVERLYVAGLEHTPRGHITTGAASDLGPAGGAVIASTLLSAAERAGAQIRTGCRVRRLLADSTGLVSGALTEDGEELHADAVVLASGGFGNNLDLLRRYWPQVAAHGDDCWYIGPGENVGDGLLMAEEAGATIIGPHSGQLIDAPPWERIVDPFTPPWLVYVNREGRRFISETASYCVLPDAVAAQTGGGCFALFDDAALTGPIDDPAFADPYGMGADFQSNWTKASLRAEIARGRVVQAVTIAELGVKIGVNPVALQGAIRKYNEDTALGRDSVFDKPAKLMLPVSTAPFYAVEVTSAVVGMTFSGVRIDENTAVLDEAGDPIPGLYAAGEIVGGLHGPTYPGGGVMIANAISFGRIAGKQSAHMTRQPTS